MKKEVSLVATLATGVALIALWILSWALSGVELGRWSIVIALAIAALKAALVVLFFMEIVVEKTSVHVALASGVALVGLMIGLMVLDVRTRWTPPLEPQVQARAQPP